jgi:DNA (cytosine-5)-methyltransferase 1
MFNYKWNISDGYPAKGIEKHNTTVMTTFSCGGGSSMGYKLAGYDVVCANDIDPQMKKVYDANHHPKQYILAPIKDLLARVDLPKVDILDGSPPCSTFSTTGLREKAWGKEKMFREGQAKQVLDDLFFDFIALAEKMQPKIVIAENVSGMLKGNAKGYVKLIVKEFERIGYKVQVFLLNASSMGVPQRRERVFFIAHKTDKTLKLSFNEKPVLYRDIRQETGTTLSNVTPRYIQYWKESTQGHPVGKFASVKRMKMSATPNTVAASDIHFDAIQPRRLYKEEIELIGSWPQDFNYCGIIPYYLIGMSVPPMMMANVAYQVYNQLINSVELA